LSISSGWLEHNGATEWVVEIGCVPLSGYGLLLLLLLLLLLFMLNSEEDDDGSADRSSSMDCSLLAMSFIRSKNVQSKPALVQILHALCPFFI
jgi:hypothetical protein